MESVGELRKLDLPRSRQHVVESGDCQFRLFQEFQIYLRNSDNEEIHIYEKKSSMIQLCHPYMKNKYWNVSAGILNTS